MPLLPHVAKLNKTFLLHILVITGLCSVAIWDISSIISDFIFDNQLTLVKIKTVNGGPRPFLSNVTISACFETDSSMFSELWPKERPQTRFDIHSTFEIATLALGSLNLSAEASESDLEQKLLLGYLSNDLKKMDLDGFKCIKDPTDNSSSCSKLLEYSYLNFVEEHFARIDQLELDLYNQILRRILEIDKDDSLSSESLSDLSLSYFDQRQLCAYLNVSRILHAGTEYTRLFVGPLGDKDFMMNATSNLNLNIALVTPDFDSIQMRIEPDSVNDIIVRIKNIGIFERTLTWRSKCIHESEELRLHGFRHICEAKQYLRAMYDHCGCVPFRFRGMFRRYFSDLSMTNATRMCSPAIYRECLDTMRTATSKFVPDCPPTCVTIKNQYSMSVNRWRGIGTAPSGRFYLASLAFECKDTSYAYYEERYQLSLQQLISQLGGDIGLYTGLSILSVWWFLVFLYSMRRRAANHGRRITEDGSENAVPAIMLRYVMDEQNEGEARVQNNKTGNSMMRIDSERLMESRVARLEEGFEKIKISGTHFEEILNKRFDAFEARILSKMVILGRRSPIFDDSSVG